MNDQLDEIGKRVRSVFDYLKALHEARNPTIREVSDVSWAMWLDSEAVDCQWITKTLRRRQLEQNHGPILRVCRPKLTSCIAPPESIKPLVRRAGIRLNVLKSHGANQ